jgi:fluoride exporter
MQKTIKFVGWLAGNQLVLLAIAGAIGTLTRYWLSDLVQRFCGAGFPWGTAVINVLGCLLFGVIWTFAEDRLLISPQTRVVALTGFMGAFTTFSTFAFETAQMLGGSEWLRALGNIVLHNAVGVVAVVLGFALGRNI